MYYFQFEFFGCVYTNISGYISLSLHVIDHRAQSSRRFQSHTHSHVIHRMYIFLLGFPLLIEILLSINWICRTVLHEVLCTINNCFMLNIQFVCIVVFVSYIDVLKCEEKSFIFCYLIVYIHFVVVGMAWQEVKLLNGYL